MTHLFDGSLLRSGLGLLTALAVGCSSGDGGSAGSGSGGGGDLAFHGDVPALTGFAYDTGELPATGPVQIDLTFAAGGTIAVDEGARVNDGKLAGTAQSGKLHVDVHFTLKGHAKAKTALKSYDGDVPGLTNVDIHALGDAPFDPFLLDAGQTVEATSPIAPTKLPDIPLGSVPGHLELTIVDGSQLVTSFAGDCMTVASGSAQLTGTAKTHGTVILHGTLVPDLPSPLNKPIDIGQIDVKVPEMPQALTFGAVAVADATDATSGTCGAAGGGGGGGGGGDDAGAGGGDGATTGDAGGGGGGGDGGGGGGGGDAGSTVPTTGLVADYPLDGTGIDVGPYGASLTGSGVPTLATDRFGRAGGAIHFDGSSQQILTRAAFTQLPVGSAARSMSVWARTSTTSSKFMSLVGWGTASNNQRFGLSMSNANGGTAMFTAQNNDLLAGTTGTANGAWHHLCIVVTPLGVISLSVDTVQITTASPLATQGQDLVLGRKVAPANDEYYTGDLDDLRIYDRDLTPTEVRLLFHENGYAP